MPSSALASCSSTLGSTRAPLSTPWQHYTSAVSPSYAAQFEFVTNTAPSYGRRGIDGRPCTALYARASLYAEPKLNTCFFIHATPIIVSDALFYRKMCKPDPVTQLKRLSSGGFLQAEAAADADITMVMEQRRKSRLRLPFDDDEESNVAQADEEPLARSRVRTGLANVDTRRRSGVVVTASSSRGDL
jgi:hypothetical protein